MTAQGRRAQSLYCAILRPSARSARLRPDQRNALARMSPQLEWVIRVILPCPSPGPLSTTPDATTSDRDSSARRLPSPISIERAEPPQHIGWNTEAYSATDIREDESVRYAALSHPTRSGAPRSMKMGTTPSPWRYDAMTYRTHSNQRYCDRLRSRARV